MPKVKEIIPMILPLILTFYFVYPQALDIRGSSFISLSGIVGLAVYMFHRFPFREVVFILVAMFIMFFWFLTSSWVNNITDHFTTGYLKSQVAWLFTAYLIIYVIFRTHKKPTLNTVLLYIVGSIALQSVIAFLMYINDGIKDFFYSLQMQVEYTEAIMEEAGSQRLMGYGIGFFGAGAISGIGLILISYLLMRMRLNTKEFILLTSLYVFIFYIGLFMARTTVIGAAVGFAIIAILYLMDNRSLKKQAKVFFLSSIFLMAAGYTFAMFYFSSFSSWAFELFTNFFEHGTLQTKSSSGLTQMFLVPEDLHTLIFGKGEMGFWGTDVGYSRLLYFVGIPGTLIFYIFQIYIVKLSATKDWAVNIVAISMFVYTLILNFKGWIDLNLVLYLIFFYFMYYKYYVYMPKQYLKIKKTSSLATRKRDHFKTIDVVK